MADNTTLNTGTGGDVIATDDLTTINGGATSGVKVQRVKVGFGSDATLRDVDAANPLPVGGTVTVSQGTANATPWNENISQFGGAAVTLGQKTSAASMPVVVSSDSVTNVNISTSQGNQAAVAQAITAAIADAPGVATTTSGTGQAIANVSTAGNSTFHIVTAAFVGTLVFEASLNGGVNYAPMLCVREDGLGSESSTAINTAVAFIRTYTAGIPGFTHFRVRCSAFTSGSAAVYITQGPFLLEPTPSLGASSATIGTVNAPVVTKGTQGTTGFTVQDLKDSGRVAKNITLDSFAIAATTETLQTMSFSSANGAVTTGTSYNVTAGKTFRVQSIVATLHTITGNTTAVNVIVRIRANAAGAAIVTSPLQLVVALQGIAAANSAAPPILVDVPDGWEFPGGTGIGFTSTCAGFVATTAAPKLDITLIGYEY